MKALAGRPLLLRLPFTFVLVAMVILSPLPAFSEGADGVKSFRAGVASVDVSPVKLPVISTGLPAGYLFYLDGPKRDDQRRDGRESRAIQFVGGRSDSFANFEGRVAAAAVFCGVPR